MLIGVLVFLIVLNLATIGSFVYTQWKRGGTEYALPGPMVGERPWGRWADSRRGAHARLRLPDAERRELRSLFDEFLTETSELREHVRDLESQTFALMQRDSVPRPQLDSLLEEIAATRLEISRKAAARLIQSKAHLTPESRKVFYDAILDSRPAGMRPGMPRHGGRTGSEQTPPQRQGQGF
jgi:uncharacterized membrane protein